MRWLGLLLWAGCQDAPGLPAPVLVREDSEAGLADPAFEALPGAKAEYGRLHGAVYQIELPDRWNGALLLWMHGFEELAAEAHATPPDFRRYLIGHGYAWGASSFSSTSMIPGRAADETAALWDYFAARHGRPRRTYVSGLSMGGWATHIAAARYGNRFDGALGFCGAAGTSPGLRISVEQFVGAAYVAGVTQATYDAAGFGGVQDGILAALADPPTHTRYEDLMITLTGGPRAFAREGFLIEEDKNWDRARLLIGFGAVPPREGPYQVDPDFDQKAIEVHSDAGVLAQFTDGTEVSGQLAMPLLTLHTSGDGQVPINQAAILRQRVGSAGRDASLVTRVIEDEGHCGFTVSEQEASLAALVEWVEAAAKPQGTDLSDLVNLDQSFEILPRPGTAAAEGVPGAGERITLSGAATLDGQPFDATFLGAVVRAGGLVAACQYTLTRVSDGQYQITVLGDGEATGCGRPGGEVFLWTFAGGEILYSTTAAAWGATHFDAAFISATPLGGTPEVSQFVGGAYHSDGSHWPPGTEVEARIGDTLCGVTSTRRTGSYDGYILNVLRSGSCPPGAMLQFRAGGQMAIESVPNQSREQELDLTTP